MEKDPISPESQGTGKATQSFQAEITQLLDMMIHSLYSQREIFLRELVSNASDAIDKLKFQALTETGINTEDLHIRLEADSATKTLKIIDNGIGMDWQEVVTNIGTIAKSGTKEFLKMQKELKNQPELIGQFGVGFYSSFMVAEKVMLHTQKHGETQGVLWQSQGAGEYTIEAVPRPEGRGTTLTLHLKTFEDAEEEQDFTQEWTLKSLIKKYSDFISWPIKMKVERDVPKKDADGKDIENETEKVIEDEVLNSQKALWLKSPKDIEKEEYNEFYKHLSHDWNEPQKVIHFKAEGTMEFASLMYLPSQKPYDFNMADRNWGLNLYVKRVFIMDHCEDVLPQYLRFVSGLVDSSDLSLNVSREILQQDRQVVAIKKSLTNKVLSELKSMKKSERPEFEKFWENFGATLKEGVPADHTNKDKLADLSLFKSTHSDQWTSLEEYVERMPEAQKEIYYISGESLDVLKKSPYLERLTEKGFEVLFLTDPIDEWFTTHISEFKEKKLQSVTNENLDLDTEEEKKEKEEKKKQLTEKYQELVTCFKEQLKEDVKDVRISDRLKDSAVCLVSGSQDPSAHFERIMNQLGKTENRTKRILEINPEHPVFSKILKAPVETQKEWSEVLYGQALLAEGSNLPDPMKFSQQISQLMEQAADRFS